MHNWSDLFRKILRLSKISCPTSTHIIWNVPEKTNFPLRLLNWACVGWKLCKHPANAKVKKGIVVSAWTGGCKCKLQSSTSINNVLGSSGASLHSSYLQVRDKGCEVLWINLVPLKQSVNRTSDSNWPYRDSRSRILIPSSPEQLGTGINYWTRWSLKV